METCMNAKYLSIILILITTILFCSCEKEIQIELPQMEETIVIEGWIENNYPPYVIITKTTPYFTVIDSSSLLKLYVLNAKVTVSDGIISEELKLPDHLTPNIGFFPFIAYQGKNLKGEVGKTYTLTVEVNNKKYTSKTTIPRPVKYDSIWFKLDEHRIKDSLGVVWFKFSDPADEQNFYRIYYKRKNQDNYYIPTLPATFEDKFFNGKSFVFNVFRGRTNYMTDIPEEDRGRWRFFKVGDTIIFRTASIDKETYLFWKEAEVNMNSGGNPFTNPAPIPTNIAGGALGIWGGYGTTYDTIIAK